MRKFRPYKVYKNRKGKLYLKKKGKKVELKGNYDNVSSKHHKTIVKTIINNYGQLRKQKNNNSSQPRPPNKPQNVVNIYNNTNGQQGPQINPNLNNQNTPHQPSNNNVNIHNPVAHQTPTPPNNPPPNIIPPNKPPSNTPPNKPPNITPPIFNKTKPIIAEPKPTIAEPKYNSDDRKYNDLEEGYGYDPILITPPPKKEIIPPIYDDYEDIIKHRKATNAVNNEILLNEILKKKEAAKIHRQKMEQGFKNIKKDNLEKKLNLDERKRKQDLMNEEEDNKHKNILGKISKLMDSEKKINRDNILKRRQNETQKDLDEIRNRSNNLENRQEALQKKMKDFKQLNKERKDRIDNILNKKSNVVESKDSDFDEMENINQSKGVVESKNSDSKTNINIDDILNNKKITMDKVSKFCINRYHGGNIYDDRNKLHSSLQLKKINKNGKYTNERREEYIKRLIDTYNIPLDTLLEQSGRGMDNNNDGMRGDQIQEILKKETGENIPVIAADEMDTILPLINKNKKEFGFVINSDESDGPGQHWRACYINREKGEIDFYDSLVSEPTEQFLKGLYDIMVKWQDDVYYKLKINRIKDQRNDTSTCGQFTIKFLSDMYDGKKFKEASGYDNTLKGEGMINEYQSKWNYF